MKEIEKDINESLENIVDILKRDEYSEYLDSIEEQTKEEIIQEFIDKGFMVKTTWEEIQNELTKDFMNKWEEENE